MRALLCSFLVLASHAVRAAPEVQTVTIETPFKVNIEFPKEFSVELAQIGNGLEIHARKGDDKDAPAMMLLSMMIDLGTDAGEDEIKRFLRGPEKTAKVRVQNKVLYVLNADDPNKVPNNSFIKDRYRAARDGVVFSLSLAVVKGRESEAQAVALRKAVPAILASVKRAK